MSSLDGVVEGKARYALRVLHDEYELGRGRSCRWCISSQGIAMGVQHCNRTNEQLARYTAGLGARVEENTRREWLSHKDDVGIGLGFVRAEEKAGGHNQPYKDEMNLLLIIERRRLRLRWLHIRSAKLSYVHTL